MVVWENGGMKKDDYKRFSIRTVAGADDFASLREVLHAALRPGARGGRRVLPDLVLIDGGRGQLNVGAQGARRSSGSTTSPSIALAKQAGGGLPARAACSRWSSIRRRPRSTRSQRIRDEAHRFAITYHKKLRRSGRSSRCSTPFPGVGPTIRTSLLKTLGSARRVREASVAELAAVPKVTPKLAQRILRSLPSRGGGRRERNPQPVTAAVTMASANRAQEGVTAMKKLMASPAVAVALAFTARARVRELVPDGDQGGHGDAAAKMKADDPKVKQAVAKLDEAQKLHDGGKHADVAQDGQRGARRRASLAWITK